MSGSLERELEDALTKVDDLEADIARGKRRLRAAWIGATIAGDYGAAGLLFSAFEDAFGETPAET